MKPLVIFKAALSGRFYATRSVKQLPTGHMICTGKKEDITEQIEALLSTRAPSSDAADNARIAELEERAEGYEEALQRILQWADAYPETVFTPPNYKKIHETLTANGFEPGHTLDGIAADSMRRATEGMGAIARAALAGSSAPTAAKPAEVA